MTAARVRRIAEEIAVARCKVMPEADATTVARRALEEAEAIENVLGPTTKPRNSTAPQAIDLRQRKALMLLRRHGIK